jgi:predicted lipoprotein
VQTTPLLKLAAEVRPAQPTAKAGANAKAAPNPKAAQAARAVLAAVDRHIVPSYRALAEAADAEEKAWSAFAANRAQGDIESLRTAYNTTADAWARAQLVKTGPLSLFLRYERFAYWPEARNVTQRMLDQLIASNDPKELAPETLVRDSVAAQGLTALERLLYDDATAQLLKAPGQAGEWRTQVGHGIARNMSSIAKDVVAEWTAPDGVRAAIATNKAWKTIFADTAEAASLLLTDLVTAFRLIHDVKLLPVMGASADVARPRIAESWRSGRSQRNLKLNLESAQALTRVWAETVPAAHRTKLDSLYAQALKATDSVPADLGEAAADPMRRPLVDAARAGVKAVQLEIATTLPADLGITLGFNSLDGD